MGTVPRKGRRATKKGRRRTGTSPAAESPPSPYVFQGVRGRPNARKLRAFGGTVAAADGVTFFDLAQAEKHFKLRREQLVELWEDAFGRPAPRPEGEARSDATDRDGWMVFVLQGGQIVPKLPGPD